MHDILEEYAVTVYEVMIPKMKTLTNTVIWPGQ